MVAGDILRIGEMPEDWDLLLGLLEESAKYNTMF
jgi:hypothetical protein